MGRLTSDTGERPVRSHLRADTARLPHSARSLYPRAWSAPDSPALLCGLGLAAAHLWVINLLSPSLGIEMSATPGDNTASGSLFPVGRGLDLGVRSRPWPRLSSGKRTLLSLLLPHETGLTVVPASETPAAPVRIPELNSAHAVG